MGNRIAKAAEAFLVDLGRENQVRNYQWEFSLIEDDKVVNALLPEIAEVKNFPGLLRCIGVA